MIGGETAAVRNENLPRARPGHIVVIGVGCARHGDDAAGPLAAAALRGAVPAHVAVRVSDGETPGLLEAWEDADVVLLIDAVRTGDPPGTVHRWELGEEPFAPPLRIASSHAAGLAETIETARRRGRLPRRVVLWGIEARHCGPGREPSADVARGLLALVEGVRRELVSG